MDAVDLVREWYSDMNGGRFAAAVAKMDPGIEWVEAEHSPYGLPGAPLVGPAAIAEAVWSRLGRDWIELHVVPAEFMSTGRSVIVTGRYVGRHARSGRRLDAQILHLWDVRDHRIIRYRGFGDTYALWEPIAQQYKATARAVFDAWNTGNLEVLDGLVAENVRNHDPHEANAAEGLDHMKATILHNRSAFPDLSITVEDQVAEVDRVVSRWSATMTHLGTGAGEPPGGRSIRLDGVTIDRFESDVVVETWQSMGSAILRAAGLEAGREG